MTTQSLEREFDRRRVYRPEIDGLRAIAITSVLLFHVDLPFLGGGFLGVDVFFVISGFLLTEILTREEREGRFSIVGYLDRRARRILPALFVVGLASTACAWYFLLPSEFIDFAHSLGPAVFLYSNVFFWQKIDYFTHNIDGMPLIHTWSLAIEGQFYAIIPIFIYAWRATTPRLATYVILGVGAASLLAAARFSSLDPQFSFYLIVTRLWEFGAGALASFIGGRWKPSGVVRECAAAAGLALIGLSVCLTTSSVASPIPAALAPVIGSALFIAFGGNGARVGSFLAAGPIAGLGKISYSVYLWHQPVLAFARARFDLQMTAQNVAILYALTVVLSVISWKWVETPFQNRSTISRQSMIGASAVCCLVLLAIVVVVPKYRGFPSRFSSQIAAVDARTDAQSEQQSLDCFSGSRGIVPPERACHLNADLDGSIAIWGDSHAMVIADRFAAALAPLKKGLRVFSFERCPPISGLHLNESGWERQCPAYNDNVFRYLAARPDIDTVVLMARWSMYFDGEMYNNGEGGVAGKPRHILAFPADMRDDAHDDARRLRGLADAVQAQIAALRAAGKRVVLVYPIPEIGWEVPERMARRIAFQLDEPDAQVSVSVESFEVRSRDARAAFDGVPANNGLLRIDPADAFCGVAAPARCAAELNGVPLYFDDNHLNAHGADKLAALIIQAMKSKQWL